VTSTPDGAVPHQPRLGLALSGGTARTVAHIGVLKALEAEGVRVDCVAGTSGGSLIACLYAAGLSAHEIERRALGVRWKTFATITLPRLGFLSSQGIQDFVEDVIGDVTFSQLRLPLAIVATNLSNGQKRIFTTGKVSLAVRASCSIPQIFVPCEVDGELYIDGGIVEYLPVTALEPFQPQVILGVNLGAYREPLRRPKHILQIILQMTSVVSRQNVPASEARASFVLRPDLSRFSPFMLERAREMIEIGNDEATRRMPEFLEVLKREASPLRRLYAGLTARHH
jgi:NTE family protein